MWNTFLYNDEPYIIKLTVEKNILQLCLSNLRILCREEISFKDSSDRFKEMNPLLESTEQGVIEQIVTMINNITKDSVTEMKQNDISLSLIIESPLDVFNIKFKFILSKLPNNIFFSEVTGSLIQTIKYLEKSHKLMGELLMKKDRELEEYRLEKGNITREDLVTKPYTINSKENDAHNSLMLNLFDNTAWTKFADEFGNTEIEKERLTNKITNNEKTVKKKIYSGRTSKR